MEINKPAFEEESEATITIKQFGEFFGLEVEGEGFAYDMAVDIVKDIMGVKPLNEKAH